MQKDGARELTQGPSTPRSSRQHATAEQLPSVSTFETSTVGSKPQSEPTKSQLGKGYAFSAGAAKTLSQTGTSLAKSAVARSDPEDTLDSIPSIKMETPIRGASVYEKREYLETQLDSLVGQQILDHFTVLGGVHHRLSGGEW